MADFRSGAQNEQDEHRTLIISERKLSMTTRVVSKKLRTQLD